jgi:YrbI family 3-deoxy-D-manno-octulosonate 8-phosphate phosphatase
LKIKVLICDIDGTLTDGNIYMSTSGDSMIQYSKIDGEGFSRLKEKGILTVWITKEKNCQTHLERAIKLKIDHFLNSEDKFITISEFLKSKNLSWSEAAYIGDDFSDLQCLLEAGISYCPKNSIIDLYVNKDFERVKRTNLESGKGCVREVIEKIITI